jgi:hypothetical protein
MQIWNPNSGKHVPMSRLLNPFDTGPWAGLASGPALHACLSRDVPLPMDSDQVQLHFSGIECMALEGRPAPVIVASAVLQRTTAVHWLLDATDPVTWRAMDAWDEQRGCQVLVSHDDEKQTVALGLQFSDKVCPRRMFPELRDLCGHELTACFLHAAWHALHRHRLERQMARRLKAKNRNLTKQSACIVATPKVAEFAAAQSTAYVSKRA